MDKRSPEEIRKSIKSLVEEVRVFLLKIKRMITQYQNIVQVDNVP